uniref:DUF1795 domain-containing protein n=1 Tax=Syphacia muris TaxID=451379 RepID=A0A0N5B031_9BILA
MSVVYVQIYDGTDVWLAGWKMSMMDTAVSSRQTSAEFQVLQMRDDGVVLIRISYSDQPFQASLHTNRYTAVSTAEPGQRASKWLLVALL